MHPNTHAMLDAYGAFARGNIEAVSAAMSDGVVWHQGGTSHFAGDFVGKPAVLAHFADLMTLTSGTFRQEIHAALGDDDHCILLGRHIWDRPAPFAGMAIYVWHMTDGIGTECWATPFDQAAQDIALTAARAQLASVV